ncbi:MAG: reprolysin-like metallopeptidase [Flavobacteriaceae bacterium]
MKRMLLAVFTVLVLSNGYAQRNFWQLSSDEEIASLDKKERGSTVLEYHVFALDFDGIKNVLQTAVSRESGLPSDLIVTFPNPDGELEQFRVYEASVMHRELATKHPDIKSYVGIGLDDKTAMIRFSTTLFGFHGMTFSGKSGTSYIDPYTTDLNYYIVYAKKNTMTTNPFECLVESTSGPEHEVFFSQRNNIQALANNGLFRTYRLAMACTIEYAAFHVNAAGLNSGTESQKKAAVLAAMNVTMTRVNGIYERDMALTMVLVPNNENVIFITSDNFNNDNAGQLINQSQNVIDGFIGSANYDIGHTVSTGGGGLAQMYSPCSGSKARGVTGTNQPVGDPFDIDYVAHEMGHQWGANHTFNNSCSGNRNNSTAVEPGSGSTIMAYAGICPPNVQWNSDAHFHAVSLAEMDAFVNNQANCSVNTGTGNAAPVVTSIPSYNIPYGTPFVLRGNATDTDSNNLTYSWEQTNPQISTQPPLTSNTSGPNFRSLPPSTSPDRYMPSLPNILAGNLAPTWEVVPFVGRSMNFAFTVRDNGTPFGGQTARANMTVTTSGSIGPFSVTSQNSSTSWTTTTQQTITWNVAGTTNAPVNTSHVNILLSTNGGTTFPIVLAANTPNDGSEEITVPGVNTNNARIMVEAVNNIYFAVNSTSFPITGTVSTEDFKLDNFTVYPNPNNGTFTVAFDSQTSNDITISVYDIRGRQILSQQYQNTGTFNQNISLNNVEAGIYMVNVEDGNTKEIRKIVVE